MQHCFLCGRPIKPTTFHLRRRVRTGEWLRRGYRGGAFISSNAHSAKRIVCSRCAARIDRQEMLSQVLAYLPEFLILLGALFVFLLR